LYPLFTIPNFQQLFSNHYIPHE
jgi:hypothetical protein